MRVDSPDEGDTIARMRNPHSAAYTIPGVARWVRDAIRLEARSSGRTSAQVIEALALDGLHPDIVTMAKGRAAAKAAAQILGAQYRDRTDLMAYLRATPIDIPREARRAAIPPARALDTDPGLVGPGEDEAEALPTTPRGRRTFLRDAPE